VQNPTEIEFSSIRQTCKTGSAWSCRWFTSVRLTSRSDPADLAEPPGAGLRKFRNFRDKYQISIYDSNFPNRDNARLHLQRLQVGTDRDQPVFGLLSREVIPGELDKEVRGFFRMNYQAANPPGA
jgi:hypothetical protein